MSASRWRASPEGMVSGTQVRLDAVADARQRERHGRAALEERCERVELPLAGGTLMWRKTGEGPPLVLLHGGHGNWLHWAPVIPLLSAHFALWLPDMPGYGDSTAVLHAGLDDLVDTLHQGVDRLFGVGAAVHLAGFSFGGLVAARLAAQRAGTARLVLVGPAGHGGPRRPRQALKGWQGLDPAQDAGEWREVMRHNLLAHMLHREASVTDLAIEIHTRGCLQTRFRSKLFSRAPLLGPALDQAGVPVLLLYGEHDVTLDPAHLPGALGMDRPGRTVRMVAGAGHWAMHEDPQTVSTLMARWLAWQD